MKTTYLKSVPVLIVFLIALFLAQPVAAHGDEPRIEISGDRLNPGSALEIRGVDFEFEEAVILSLVGPRNEIPLGTVSADTEGIFLLTISLPVDLAEGTYVIRAITDDHTLESPQITVWGSADLGGGENGPVSEEDGLLFPMPTPDPNAPTPVLGSSFPIESKPVQNSSVPFPWIAPGIGIAVALALLLRIKR